MFRPALSAALCVGFIAVSGIIASAASGTRTLPCSRATLLGMADSSHTKMSPCIAKHHAVILETTYYQNASKVGGSALAAFPEARIRYGAFPGVELFVDTPSEIAKSGEGGRGIYFMTQTGYGAKFEVARIRGVTYSITGETHPPLGALANLNLVPISDIHLSANWSGSERREFGAEIGTLNYQTVRRQHIRSSELFAGSITQTINPLTSLTFEMANQSNVYWHSRSQTSSVVALNRALTRRMLFDFEIGTAFNAAGGSKPHYMGFGFAYH